MNSANPTESASPQADEFPVIDGLPRRGLPRVGRWIFAALCFLSMGFIVRAFALGRIDWPYVATFFTAPVILHGLGNTLVLTVAAMLLGIALGLAAALMRLSQNPVASAMAAGYIWFFRGTPVYLQLLIWFNLALVFPAIAIPGIWEIKTVTMMTPFLAAFLGLGICQGAYTAEVIRGGILSIDSGQHEAGQAIGMTRWQVMRHVVLPQTLRAITPPIGNELISMLKATSLAAVISYGELIHSASLIYYVNNRVIELLIVCAIYYLIAVSVLSVLQQRLELRLSRSVQKTRAQTGAKAQEAVL